MCLIKNNSLGILRNNILHEFQKHIVEISLLKIFSDCENGNGYWNGYPKLKWILTFSFGEWKTHTSTHTQHKHKHRVTFVGSELWADLEEMSVSGCPFVSFESRFWKKLNHGNLYSSGDSRPYFCRWWAQRGNFPRSLYCGHQNTSVWTPNCWESLVPGAHSSSPSSTYRVSPPWWLQPWPRSDKICNGPYCWWRCKIASDCLEHWSWTPLSPWRPSPTIRRVRWHLTSEPSFKFQDWDGRA